MGHNITVRQLLDSGTDMEHNITVRQLLDRVVQTWGTPSQYNN